MNEFLPALLQAVLIAAVTAFAGAIIAGVKAVARYLASKTDNEIARKYLEDVADAVGTAVTYTSQKYVDRLKSDGEFTKEKQEEALQLAVNTALALLTEEARVFLMEAYGDLNDYLVSKIEAEVRRQKNVEATAVSAVELSEVIESQDVATVAATTAAATAAAVIQQSVTKTETFAPNISVALAEAEQTE